MLAEIREAPATAITWQPCLRDQWEGLLSAAGRSPLEQSWAYGEAVAARHGQQVERHIVTCDGTPAALLQSFHKICWRLAITRILRGPLWLIDPLADRRGAEICRSIAGRWRRHPLRFLSWLPELPDDPRSTALIEATGLRRVVTGYASAWLDLRQDREALLGGLHAKWHAALRRGERAALTIGEDGKQRHWQAALMLYEGFRRKKRFVGLSADFIAALAAAEPSAALSLTARRGATPVAGVILLRHGKSATYTASWTSDEGRAGQAHNLLLWRAIETLQAGGTQWLDLGGLNTESQPGLARFKLGLGGEVFTLTGSYL